MQPALALKLWQHPALCLSLFYFVCFIRAWVHYSSSTLCSIHDAQKCTCCGGCSYSAATRSASQPNAKMAHWDKKARSRRAKINRGEKMPSMSPTTTMTNASLLVTFAWLEGEETPNVRITLLHCDSPKAPVAFIMYFTLRHISSFFNFSSPKDPTRLLLIYC